MNTVLKLHHYVMMKERENRYFAIYYVKAYYLNEKWL
jgi:hypothetical protein